ncbi:MAG TPA: FtsX-like permease family protein [Polyangia bacterium]|nr:FtsX-like permease family protein [Polyangia bacterium]HWE27539.1 FtsX-like permease family protein [Polyangia bacterium]
MSYFLLIFKSAFRNRLRTLLTSVGVAIAIVAFLFLRTFIGAWYSGLEGAQSDRVIVRNKISITFPMPLTYVDKVRNIVGDKGVVSYENWFGATYAKDEHGFFANLACDDDIFKMYPELVVTPEQWKAYVEDRQGAMIGSHLAEKYGWKIGDRVTLTGTIFPGNWDFNIRAIYDTTARNIDKSTLYFHWKYMNEKLDERLKDNVGLIFVKVNDPAQSSALQVAIDRNFANSLAETRTESEKAFQLEFLSMASALVGAIQIISGVVLVILMLILANTLAMATRERTTEYAVMRAIGFHPRHIVGMVLGEGFIIALVGVLIGVTLSAPVIKFSGQLLEKQMGAFLGSFDLRLGPVLLSIGVAIVLGMLAAALPAWRAGKLKIVDALRRVE